MLGFSLCIEHRSSHDDAHGEDGGGGENLCADVANASLLSGFDPEDASRIGNERRRTCNDIDAAVSRRKDHRGEEHERQVPEVDSRCRAEVQRLPCHSQPRSYGEDTCGGRMTSLSLQPEDSSHR